MTDDPTPEQERELKEAGVEIEQPKQPRPPKPLPQDAPPPGGPPPPHK